MDSLGSGRRRCPHFRARALLAFYCGCGSRPRSAPSRGRRHAPSAFAPAHRPPWASLPTRDPPPVRKKGPENLISSSVPAPGRPSGAGGGEVAARTSCLRRPTESAGKVFSAKGRRVLLARRSGLGGSGADGAELGPRSRGVKVRVGRSLAPQLSTRTAGPASAAPPPPPSTKPLPAAAAAAAEVGSGSKRGERTGGSGRSCPPTGAHLPAYPAPRRPFLSAPQLGLR